MIGGDGNTRAIFTYAHDYQRSPCKGIDPVSGAGSISANTMDSVNFMVVTHKMSVSSQHETLFASVGLPHCVSGIYL